MPPIGADDFERIPDSVYSEEPAARSVNGSTRAEVTRESVPARRVALNWEDLETREPPPRDWIIPHWIPHGCTTLLSGSGGIGKTLLAQHIATAFSIGYEYIEPMPEGRVLMWAGEDDEGELWRRQIAISRFMGSRLSDLAERFALHSFSGDDITLMAPVYGKLETTPMLTLLREQVGDYRPQLVILDNVARLFGGSENERHGVTTFCAVVQGACAPAAVLLLGHPAKAQGSEYSGSTAWEGAVRARLYLSGRPPDAKDDDDEGAPVDDSVRFLSRRKSNYAALDLRRFTLADGVLTPDRPAPAGASIGISGEFAKDVVRKAVKKLAERQLHGVLSKSSGNYLPKMAAQYGLLERMNSNQFGKVMRSMVLEGELAMEKIGQYANRTAKMGLVHK